MTMDYCLQDRDQLEKLKLIIIATQHEKARPQYYKTNFLKMGIKESKTCIVISDHEKKIHEK